MESSHRWIEHTAELQLELHGRSEAAVFRQAVHALRELLEEEAPATGARIERPVEAEATDRGALLAEWLAELVVVAAARAEPLVGVADQLASIAAGRRTCIGGRGASAALAARLGAEELPQDPVAAADLVSAARNA